MTDPVSPIIQGKVSNVTTGERNCAAERAEGASPSSADESFRLISHAIVNSSGLIVSGTITVLLVPVMLNYLGRQFYGLWIAMESVATLLASIDLGLTWTVTREIAANGNSEDCADLSSLAGMGATVLLLVGLSGWIVMAALGRPIGAAFKVPEATSSAVFIAGGAVFLCERLRLYALSVLRGARRFDIANGAIIFAAILWSLGAILLLAAGFGLIPLVAWQALAAALAAAATFAAARWWAPKLDLRLRRPSLTILRRHAAFSLWSQLAALAGGAIWEIPPLLIGVLLGSQQIVPYHVGRIFPSAASALAWRSAEVLLPAASESNQRKSRTTVSEVLDTGIRLSLAAILPISIVLWICAPRILALWVGIASTESVTIMRLLVLVEFLDAATLGCATVLWGIGEVRRLIVVDATAVAGVAALCAVLVSKFGATGVAIALLIVMGLAAPVYVIAAARRCDAGAVDLLRSAAAGLGLPAAACITIAWSMNRLLPTATWTSLIIISLASAIAYAGVFQGYGARPEEARLLSLVRTFPSRLAKALLG